MSAPAERTRDVLRIRVVAGLIVLPAVIASLAAAGVESWRLVRPQSSLFSPPKVYSLADAIERFELEQAFHFLRLGQDPNADIGVRHQVMTRGHTIPASPLLWAAAVGNEDAVKMLLGFGARLDTLADRMAACVADALGHGGVADLLRTVGAASSVCRGLHPAASPLLSVLAPNGSIRSANGYFRLIYQGDGNLVLYDQRTQAATWATHTAGTTAGYAALNGDGALVVYDAHGQARWSTNLVGEPPAVLIVGDDGNVVIDDGRGRRLWQCCP